jgi:hypothetical protein
MSSTQQLLLGEGAGGAIPAYIEEVFSTWLYPGNSSTQTITNGIDLATNGGLVWIKKRNGAELHQWWTTVLGNTSYLRSNGTEPLFNSGSAAITYNTTGFSLNTGSSANNQNGDNYVGWTFQEKPKFFDVVTGTQTVAGNVTLNHNLGSVPGCIIVKNTDNGNNQWNVYHRSLGTASYLNLETSDAASSGYAAWGGVAPTSTQFTIGYQYPVGTQFVAYLFAHDAGGFGLAGTDNVISCGSYAGNGSSTGPITSLGYEPQWVLIKKSSGGSFGAGSSDWTLFDIMRGLSDSDRNDNYLNPNNSGDENSLGGANFIKPLSTGFQLTSTSTLTNQSGSTYIYIAIRRGPMKVPTLGTTVFNPYTATLSAGTIVNVGLTPDLTIGKYRGGADVPRWVDRLRAFATSTGGAMPEIRSNSSDAEASSTAWTFNWTNTGFTIGNALNGLNTIIYSMRRAPSFFDEVCYTGNGSDLYINHNLGVFPQLIITKSRSATANWTVTFANDSSFSQQFLLGLNVTDASFANIGGQVIPVSSTQIRALDAFGSVTASNANGVTYVSYLFATCAGVSKVGSYTGTGATQTVNCGFTTGARFVMVKRTDSTGNWFYWDTARGMVSGTDPYLLMNSNVGETNTNSIYTESTGFQIVSTAAEINASGGTYLFLAIA